MIFFNIFMTTHSNYTYSIFQETCSGVKAIISFLKLTGISVVIFPSFCIWVLIRRSWLNPSPNPQQIDMCRHDHYDLLLRCQYVFQHKKNAMAKSKLYFICCLIGIWNKLPGHFSFISTLPAFRKRLKHHLFLSASPVIHHLPLASRFVISAQLRSYTMIIIIINF